MFKLNWVDIEPGLAYDGICYVRDYFGRRDRPGRRGSYTITKYIEWVSRMTVPPETRMLYHSHNLEEILFVLEGRGAIKAKSRR